MKNKKFLCLVLALVMVLGAFGPVFAETKAADDKKVEDKKEVKVEKVNGREAKVQWLVDHKFVEGRKVNEDPKNNDLALDKTIKRSEITKLLVYAIGRQELAEKIQGTKIYKDVEATHWANGVITVGTSLSSPANNVPFLNGYPDGTFKPENNVTYGELAKMLVTLVKKDLTKDMHDGANKPGIWPGRWITWATELGILDDVKLEDGNKAALRSDAFVMLYNALYKMTNLRKVPANETMGIISGYSKGKLVLNQEGYKKEFTVNADTNFVYGRGFNEYATFGGMVNWNDTQINANRGYYLGALVRVLADDKGVVTHIIQLGSPVLSEGTNEYYNDFVTNGWRTVADGTIGTDYVLKDGRHNTTVDVANDKLTFNGGHITVRNGKNNVYDNYDRDGNVFEVTQVAFEKPLDINLTGETRYFVADYHNGYLTEVKDLDAVKVLLDKTKDVYDVYAGFDVLPKTDIKEATVVVFNSVHVGGGDIVRVIGPVQTNFLFDAHKPNMVKANAEVVSYDLRNDKVEFPFNKNWEKYDVLDITRRVDGVVAAEKLIDGSHDPIYKITKVNNKTIDTFKYVPGRRIDTIELTDNKGKLTVDVRVDTDYFFGDEVKPGAFAQVRFLEVENEVNDELIYKLIPAVDIISVRDDVKDVRGELPKGLKPTNLKEVSGVISKIEAGDAKGYSVFTIKEGDSQYPTRYVATTKALEGYVVGDQVTFLADVATKYAEYDAPLAYEFKNPAADARAQLVKDINALASPVTSEEEAVAVDKAKAAYDALSDAEKAKLGDAVKALLDTAVGKAADFRKVAEATAQVEAVTVPEQANTVTADDLKNAVQAEVDKLALPEGVTATAVAPTKVEKGKENIVKVTLTHANAEDQEANVKVTVQA